MPEFKMPDVTPSQLYEAIAAEVRAAIDADRGASHG